MYLEEAPLEQVSTFKYLGVTISGNLTWSIHILAICCKAKHFIGFLYRNLRDVSRNSCIRSVQPVLEHCNCVWDHQTVVCWLGIIVECPALVTSPAHCSFHKYLCRWILVGQSLISSSPFIPHPSLIVRHANSCPLFQSYIKTYSHRQSFFSSVAPFWNSAYYLHELYLAFKKHLKYYLLV